jgi:hypothetical protein
MARHFVSLWLIAMAMVSAGICRAGDAAAPAAADANKPIMRVESHFLRLPRAVADADPFLRRLSSGAVVNIADEDAQRIIGLNRREDTSIITGPLLTVIDRQFASLKIGQDIAYVKDLIPDGAGNLTPKADVVYTGVSLDVRCTVRPDFGRIVVDAHPRWATLVAMPSVPWHNNPAELVQQPITRGTDMQVSSTVPSGSTLLIVADPKISPAGASTTQPLSNDRLFVLIKPTIITN